MAFVLCRSCHKSQSNWLFDLLRYRNFEVFPVLPEVEAFLLVLPARYEGEARGRKSEEKHEGRSGALPVTRFIFFELFFTSGRFSRELSERSERIISCLVLVPLFKSQYTNKFQSWSPQKEHYSIYRPQKLYFPYQLN